MTILLSDIHLGTIACKSPEVLTFLKYLEITKVKDIILIGDIIDIWRLKNGGKWKSEHNTILQKLLRLSRKGVNITYISGNHDDFFRVLENLTFGDIPVIEQSELEINGKKFWIIHGDQFDFFLRRHIIIGKIGCVLYDGLVMINHYFTKLRSFFNLKPWSLSQYIKQKAKAATNVVLNFENSLIQVGKSKGYDGVICGHIHTAEIKVIDDFIYVNTGDWVESCTFINTTQNGIELYKFNDAPIKLKEMTW